MFGSLLFLIHECWLNIRRQSLMVISCISTTGAALLILGVSLLLAWHVTTLAASVPKQFEVHAFIRTETPRSEVEELQRRIQQLPSVAQVKLVPKEVAWPEFRRNFPDLAVYDENPLPDKLEIVAATPEDTVQVSDVVRAMPEVEQVNDARETLRTVLAIARVVRLASLAMALLIAFGAVAIVANAIRLTLYARRRDIRVMQLVGATDSFIRLPYVLEGLLAGALGGALAAAAIAGLTQYVARYVQTELAFVAELRLNVEILPLALGLMVGGALFGMFGSLISLRRFLRAA